MENEDAILARLRAATEADVEAALALPSTDGNIEFVSCGELLAFFNRMLDILLA